MTARLPPMDGSHIWRVWQRVHWWNRWQWLEDFATPGVAWDFIQNNKHEDNRQGVRNAYKVKAVKAGSATRKTRKG